MPRVFLRLLTWLLLLPAYAATTPEAQAQEVHTEAAEAYWRLTDLLRRDEPLTDAAWQQFLALPDNQTYISSIYSEDDLRAYRRALEITYMPRHDSLRRAKLKGGGWFYRLLSDYKEREPIYKAFLAETARNPAYLEKMYAYAYEFLPAHDHTKVRNLRLVYVAIGDDAVSAGSGLVFSIWNAYNYQQLRPGILEAHELHHQLRTQADFGTIVPADEPLLWSLATAQNEGLADLTDKRVQVEQRLDTADAGYTRRWLLRPAPRAIQRIDSTIQVLATGGPATPLTFYRRLTRGSNGHLPGFFMAYTILQNGYRQPLLDHADDPLAFALLYQKAARKDKLRQHPPTFAPASVRYLRALQRKYAKQPTLSRSNQP